MMEVYKKNIYYDILTICIVAIVCTLLSFPVKEMINYFFNTRFSGAIAGTFTRIIIIFIAFKIIYRQNIDKFNGLRCNIKGLHLLLLPLILAGLNFYSKFDREAFYLPYFLPFVLSMLIVGLTEELVFRGIVFPLLIKKTKKIMLPALLSSVCFALIHYINLFREPTNFSGITSQVIFAFVIGIFLCGIFLRTENIYIAAFVHAVINIAFTSQGRFQQNYIVEVSQHSNPTSTATIISTLVIFSLIIFGSIYMILGVDKKRIFKILNLSD